MNLIVLYKTLFFGGGGLYYCYLTLDQIHPESLYSNSLNSLGECMDCLNGSTHIYTFTDARTPARTQGAREITRGRG